MRGKPANPWDAVARECLDEVMSSVNDSEENPLLSEIAKLEGKEKLSVADFGCGTGPLLPLLVDSFGQVVGIDASKEMLEIARQSVISRYGSIPKHLDLRCRSMFNVGPYANRFDLVLTLNSLITSVPSETRRGALSMYRSLRPGGLLLGVFPSLDSVSETVRYCYRRAYRKLGSPEAAWSSVRGRLELENMNFALGHYDVGYMVQKYYGEGELRAVLEAAGFSSVRLGRVIYGKEMSFAGVEGFGGRAPRVWHWFARGEKPD